jgi:multidrug resistance efflux pump
MKKLALIMVVSVMSIVVYAAPKEAWVAAMYKGIVDIKVQLGQQVKKGQLVFELKQDILNVDKKCNETTLKFLKKVVDGGEKLIKDHSISLDDLQYCQRDYSVAENILKSTEAQLATSKYYAPFDGTVTKIVCYDGSGLGDNDNEIQITEGQVKVDTANRVATVCTRWEGFLTLKVDEGHKVKKGQLLFSTNTDDLLAQKGEAEGKLKYLKIDYNRQKELYGAPTASHATSLYSYLLAKNTLMKEEGEVKKLDIQIKQCSMYAPFDGTVTKVYRYTGSGIGSGKPVVDITALK